MDFVMCSGTLEDLSDPLPCIREMQRVGRAGYIRIPSLVCKITVGVNGRATQEIGYSHHHWICRQTAPTALTLLVKTDAQLSTQFGCCLPLHCFERLHCRDAVRLDKNIHFFWTGAFQVEMQSGLQVQEDVRLYLQSLGLTWRDFVADALLRLARRIRDRCHVKADPAVSASEWWKQMLELSRSYQPPDLYRKAGGHPETGVTLPSDSSIEVFLRHATAASPLSAANGFWHWRVSPRG